MTAAQVRVRRAYEEPEPSDGVLAHLRELAAGDRPLTLLTATRQPGISEAAVRAGLLGG